MQFDKVLVCGSRNWDDQEVVDKVVLALRRKYNVHTVVQGEARGADTCGKRAGNKYGLTIKSYPAEWDKYGKGAGPIRNRKQFDREKPEIVVAFHDDLYNSKGTLDMVKYAMSSELETIIVVVFHDKKDEKPFKWVWSGPSVDGFDLYE
jgi:hypothetical protein